MLQNFAYFAPSLILIIIPLNHQRKKTNRSTFQNIFSYIKFSLVIYGTKIAKYFHKEYSVSIMKNMKLSY